MAAFTAFDYAMMARALRNAERGRCIATPNPFVGCVIVKQGRIIGEGFTQKGGRPHAEAMALEACSESPEGSTVYSTLEPCVRHARSRGPACSDLLIAAKVARVVSALHDPFDGVDGAGHDSLRAAGIKVDIGLMEADAARSLKAFLARVTRGWPWVTLKVAATLDGKTALANGESKWITGADARRDVHRLRAEACAVMTGIGTLMADDPELTVRDVACERQPLRVLLDSRLDVALSAKILRGGNVLIATAAHRPDRERELEAAGAEVMRVPVEAVKGKVDLVKMMEQFAQRGINHVMVETGAKLNASLLAAGVVDEIIAYIAPSIFGDSARGLFALPELTSLDQRTKLQISDVRQIGADLRVTAQVLKD
ncbi:MAG: bifunctional diaminohydroxyphosphoribosylaminopyrimidine deaminase/5-amino-6-(5-phosphoribosylamino)uracil reductase RibD [Betaproteobacteria bacterium]